MFRCPFSKRGDYIRTFSFNTRSTFEPKLLHISPPIDTNVQVFIVSDREIPDFCIREVKVDYQEIKDIK